MDNWIKNRRSDVRFSNELRRVDMKNTSWYNAGQRVNVVRETFSAAKEYKSDSKSESKKPEPTIKKKKKRMKKTESGNEKSATSDNSDGGPCWVRRTQLLELVQLKVCFSFLTLCLVFVVRRATTSVYQIPSKGKREAAVPRVAIKSRRK